MLYKVKNEWQFRRHRSDFPKCRTSEVQGLTFTEQ